MPNRKARDAKAVESRQRWAIDPDLSTKPLFEVFRWTDPATDQLLVEARALNQLIEKVIDVTDGVRAVMCVLERDGYSSEDDAPPLLYSVRQGALRRLGITSLLLLSDEATRLGDWVQVRYEQQRLEPRRSGKRKRSKLA